MKIDTPEISWHSRQPIYSLDVQPGSLEKKRLATASTDANVRLWLLKTNKEGKIFPDFLATLNRHTKPVNVVRFSPDGQLLASGADDGLCILWKHHESSVVIPTFGKEEGEEDNKETWNAFKTLRGHFEDIYDVSWAADSSRLVTGSVDNTAIIWDAKKGDKIHLFKDHRSFVQGVAWDPLNHFCATISCDRSMRIYSLQNYRCVYNVSRFPIQINNNNGQTQTKQTRMFHDDSMKSFFRRLSYTPDGQLLIVPSGCIESGDAVVNTTFIFSRLSYSKPVVHLPGPAKATVAVRCCPLLFKLRTPEPEATDAAKGMEKMDIGKDEKTDAKKEEGMDVDEEHKSGVSTAKGSEPSSAGKPEADKPGTAKKQEPNLFDLPYRMVFAVATEDSLLFYDTQQSIPFAYVSNIHYTTITDISWASDASCLTVCSTDGYVTVISFKPNEIGEKYMPVQVKPKAEVPKEAPTQPEPKLASLVSNKGGATTVEKKTVEPSKPAVVNLPREPARVDSKSALQKPKESDKNKGPRRMVTTLLPGNAAGGSGGSNSSTSGGANQDNTTPTSQPVAKNPAPRRMATTMLSGNADNSAPPGPSHAVNQSVPKPAVTAPAANKPRRVVLTTVCEPQKKE